MRDESNCFTKQLVDQKSGAKCTEEPAWFQGRLSMPLANFLLNHSGDDIGFSLFLKNEDGKLVVCFQDGSFCDELCFCDFPEGKEVQLSKKHKRLLASAVESCDLAFCQPVEQQLVSSGEVQKPNGAQTSSQVAKARTTRKKLTGAQTSSLADKARTARNSQTASHAAKASTAREEKRIMDQHDTAASFTSPLGLNLHHHSHWHCPSISLETPDCSSEKARGGYHWDIQISIVQHLNLSKLVKLRSVSMTFRT